MTNELEQIDYWVDGPDFRGFKVKAFNIFEACAKAIRANRPKSLGTAIHAWGGLVKKDDYLLIGVKHLIDNYNLGNNYADTKEETKPENKNSWYKRIFK